jgi:hypothetical protein
MGMEVDEARRNHVAGSIDGLFTGDLLLSDHGNLAILDTHIAHLVVVGLRVNDPAIEDHDIKVLCGLIAFLIGITAAIDDGCKQKK